MMDADGEAEVLLSEQQQCRRSFVAVNYHRD